MRAVTLSDRQVNSFLRRNFVCGWKNIAGAPYAGTSNSHLPSYSAKRVSNCSGHHNIQMFFMTKDAKVVHCLPGFWDARNFMMEAQFAKSLNRIYHSSSSVVRRNNKFLDLHLEHALEHSHDLADASQLQGFDKKNIERRADSDFKREDGFITGELKTGDQVMHERMAERPFLNFEEFHIPSFIDMGRKKYSYKFGMPGNEMKKRNKIRRRSRLR